MTRPRLLQQFPGIIERLGIRPGAPVLVAVSGGLDSNVLLHLLRFSNLPLDLHVAHFDHAMRSGSAGDAEWVSGFARALEVPFHGGRSEAALPSEAAARVARYEFLETTAARIGAVRIVLAHQADDQAETVLFRFLRGTGLDGLAGIPERRGRIVRPLLRFTRGELEAYTRRHRLTHREDPTNASRAYARNRIRHDLLPGIERYWPEVRTTLRSLAEQARRQRSVWNSGLYEIEKRLVAHGDTGSIELARSALLEYHPEVRARLLRRLLAQLHAPPGRAGTVAACAFINSGVSGTAIQVAGVRIERAFDTIRLSAAPAQLGGPADETLTIVSPAPGNGVIIIGGKRFQVCWSAGLDTGRGGQLPAAQETRIQVGASRFPLRIRAWEPGDRIDLAYGSKKLKKLFGERRLERRHRTMVPVVVDADNKVLWVVGLAQAAQAAGVGDEPVLSIAVSDGESD